MFQYHIKIAVNVVFKRKLQAIYRKFYRGLRGVIAGMKIYKKWILVPWIRIFLVKKIRKKKRKEKKGKILWRHATVTSFWCLARKWPEI